MFNYLKCQMVKILSDVKSLYVGLNAETHAKHLPD